MQLEIGYHSAADHRNAFVLQTLRRVYGDKVCEPVAVKVTQWASDEFSRGSYSYVAVGCTGHEYDTLALPVSRCVLFAGEHTCKEHPDSVGGEGLLTTESTAMFQARMCSAEFALCYLALC